MKRFTMVVVVLLLSFLGANMLFAVELPDPFTFTDRTDVALNTEFKSNAITVSGIGSAANISVTGGTYSINGGTYTSVSGTVSLGNTVKVRKMSAGTYSTTKNATLTIGGRSDTFSVTTMIDPADTTPNPFTFTDRTDVALSTEFKSNAITVSGIGSAAAISITGGTYSINGGVYTSASGTVNNSNTVKVRKMSAGTPLATKSATLTIGGVSDTFSVTTGIGDYTSTNIGTLKYVPAGAFLRDGANGGNNKSTVTTAFRMSRYEITRAQFLAVMGTDPSNLTYSTGTSDPVQMANWYHAIAFCNKLSIAEGFTRVYDVAGFTTDQDWTNLAYGSIPASDNADWNAATATWANTGYRLPTEMEWEWAAMGATSGSGWTSPTYLTGYGKLFAGSDSILANGSGGSHVIGDYAWTSENSGGTTHPVGTTGGTTDHFNELGLYDMSGNVFEWVWDKWDGAANYPDDTLNNNDYRGFNCGHVPCPAWRLLVQQCVCRDGCLSWLQHPLFAVALYRFPGCAPLSSAEQSMASRAFSETC